VEQEDCFLFFYGGCEGNANNFESYELCMQACPDFTPVPTISQWGYMISMFLILIIGAVYLKYNKLWSTVIKDHAISKFD
jgi:hypothetical protein